MDAAHYQPNKGWGGGGKVVGVQSNTEVYMSVTALRTKTGLQKYLILPKLNILAKMNVRMSTRRNRACAVIFTEGCDGMRSGTCAP